MKRFLLSVCCGSAIALSCSASAQEQAAYQLRVDTRLIETTVTVHDARGTLVNGLPQDAFHVREDGVEQKVRYFASKRELPLSIALIIDASGSQEKFVHEHEAEIEGFLREVMEPRDRAFAVCFGNHLRLTSDWTNSPGGIVESVRRFNKGERGFPEIGPVEERELGTALNDAIYFSVVEKMMSERGRRKVMIVLSDGEENSSEHDEVDAISAAQGADVLVYALRTTSNKEKKMTARDRYGMRLLDHVTEATGGAAFDLRQQKTDAVFASIAADLKSLYELGYYSTNTSHDGVFRKVTVTVEGDGLKARTRAGYVAH